MTDPIDKLIAKVSFPRAGELFGAVNIPTTRDEMSMGGAAVKVTSIDNSYRSDIFRCLSADAIRVVGVKVSGHSLSSAKPTILHRDQWRFDDVSLIVESLGIEKSTDAA